MVKTVASKPRTARPHRLPGGAARAAQGRFKVVFLTGEKCLDLEPVAKAQVRGVQRAAEPKWRRRYKAELSDLQAADPMLSP